MARVASVALHAVTGVRIKGEALRRVSAYGARFAIQWSFIVTLDNVSHGLQSGVLLARSVFLSVGTIYAVSLGEWLRHASPVPAMPDARDQKIRSEKLDEEAKS